MPSKQTTEQVQTVAAPGSSHPPRRWWASVLSSSTTSVLLGAIVTAILGNWVIGLVQDRNKTRELAREAYKQHLEAQARLIERTYTLISGVLTTSEDLLDITGPDFDPLHFRGKERERVIQQKTSVREHFNRVNEEWRHDRQSLGFLLSYYHDGLPNLTLLWRDVVMKLDAYSACAAKEYKDVVRSGSAARVASPCLRQREAFDNSLDRINGELLNARRYAWQEMGLRPGRSVGKIVRNE